MTDKEIINGFFLQLTGNAWKTDGDDNKYSFLPRSLNKKENPDPDLFIKDKQGNERFSKYSLSTEGQDCFLTFLDKKFRILHIDNSADPHTMKLEDESGNIIIYQSSPIVRL